MHTTLVPEPIRLNYKDYCALPDDGRRYEILDGDLFMSPAPSVFHQRLVLRLARILQTYVEAHALGEVFISPIDILLGDNDIVQPDLVFVSKAKSQLVRKENIQGAPDLLVEMVSKSSVERDTRDKRNVYARRGVDHYWLIDCDNNRVTELHRAESAYAQVAEVDQKAQWQPLLFPNLVISLADLFG